MIGCIHGYLHFFLLLLILLCPSLHSDIAVRPFTLYSIPVFTCTVFINYYVFCVKWATKPWQWPYCFVKISVSVNEYKHRHAFIPFICITFVRYGKSVAQLMIRWSVQKGYITIPKSSKQQRVLENAAVFDWTISQEDMAAIVSGSRFFIFCCV